jgi:hypothetical protein
MLGIMIIFNIITIIINPCVTNSNNIPIAENEVINNSPIFTPIGKDCIISIDSLLPEESGIYYYDNDRKHFSKLENNHLPLLASSSSSMASAPTIHTNYNNRINHIFSGTITYE